MSELLLSLALAVAACGQTASPDLLPENYLPPPESREPVERRLRGFHEYSEQLQHWFKQQATAESESEQMEAVVALCAMYHELRTDPRYPTSDALQRMKIKIWSRLSRVKENLERELARQGATASEESLGEVSGAELLKQLENSQAGAQGGGAQRGDHGDELVALIERTIAPTKWDVNGGPFTIVYYAPLHALVVRASSEVHGRVGGLLGGLRQAGN